MCDKQGCDKPVRARGYCINHYSAFREKELAATGKARIDLRRLGWDESEYESYWLWVKKELKLV